MKRLVFALLLGLTIIAGFGEQAVAHVFFTDEGNASGIIMHVTPDDDPIAGDETRFYFDIQNKAINTEDYSFKLRITDAEGVTEQAATYPVGDNSVSAKYVFPVQGMYVLTLRATPVYVASEGRKEPVDFIYSQRVSRGRVASPLDAPRHVWAEFGIVAGLAGLLVVIIVILSRRKLIVQYTKWR